MRAIISEWVTELRKNSERLMSHARKERRRYAAGLRNCQGKGAKASVAMAGLRSLNGGMGAWQEVLLSEDDCCRRCSGRRHFNDHLHFPIALLCPERELLNKPVGEVVRPLSCNPASVAAATLNH